jgi:hypothetical protein
MDIAIKNDTSWRGDWQTASSLVLGDASILRTFDDLDDVQPDAEEGEQHYNHSLESSYPSAEVLGCILKLHNAGCSNSIAAEAAWVEYGF